MGGFFAFGKKENRPKLACVVLAIKNPLYTVSGEMQMEENLPISQQLLITP